MTSMVWRPIKTNPNTLNSTTAVLLAHTYCPKRSAVVVKLPSIDFGVALLCFSCFIGLGDVIGHSKSELDRSVVQHAFQV